MDLTFEWDDGKAAGNLDKHGVDFVDAAQIFRGPTVEAADRRMDYGEVRVRAIGQHDGQVYVVIYTQRNEAIRIISAWKANRHDRENYHATITG